MGSVELAPGSQVAAASASAPIIVVYGDKALPALSTPTKATHLEYKIRAFKISGCSLWSWHHAQRLLRPAPLPP